MCVSLRQPTIFEKNQNAIWIIVSLPNERRKTMVQNLARIALIAGMLLPASSYAGAQEGNFTSRLPETSETKLPGFISPFADAKLAEQLGSSQSRFATMQNDRASAVNEIQKIVDDIIEAVNTKDTVRFSTHFSGSPDAKYFGPIIYDKAGRMYGALRREDHFRAMAVSFAFMDTVICERNPDGFIRVGDGFAIWTGTGNNFVTHKNKAQTLTPWRWTMVFELDGDKQWLVTHSHSSFGKSTLTN